MELAKQINAVTSRSQLASHQLSHFIMGQHLGQVKKPKYENMDKIRPNPVLRSYFSKINSGLTANAAAYATVCKEISQQDLAESYRGNPPGFIADEVILSITDPVYEATIKAFSSKKKLQKCLAGMPVWKFNAFILNKCSIDQRENESKKLVDMYSKMSALTFSRIINARSDESNQKAEIVYQILRAEYEEMNYSPKSINHE